MNTILTIATALFMAISTSVMSADNSQLLSSWYHYDFFGEHTIWSKLDVFVIETRGEKYKLQIVNYYDLDKSGYNKLGAQANQARKAGFYTLRLAPLDQSTESVVSLNASGCGSKHDPSYNPNCEKDFTINKFTYLNVMTGKEVKLTDVQAAVSSDWQIGFKGTEVKLNKNSKVIFVQESRLGLDKVKTEIFSGDSLLVDFEETTSETVY